MKTELRNILNLISKSKKTLFLFLFFILLLEVQFSILVSDHSGYTDHSGYVNEVKGEDLPKIHPYACIRTIRISQRKIDFMICIKDLQKDKEISGSLYKTGIYEGQFVELMLDIFQLYPQATFLDIGANIGLFSLAAAESNISVVSVEPVLQNLAFLKTSLDLSLRDYRVKFVQNTISDDRASYYGFLERPENEGGINFLSQEEADLQEASDIGEKVDSILFEDILSYVDTQTVIVKMDIEGYECKALKKWLFTENKSKFIPYIMLEFQVVQVNWENMCPKFGDFVKGLEKSGYSPIDMNTREPNRQVFAAFVLVDNILWQHEDAVKLPKLDWMQTGKS